jgi:hypothetical protein
MAMRAALKNQTGCLPNLQRQFRSDDFIGFAPDAIGTEICFFHDQSDLRFALILYIP